MALGIQPSLLNAQTEIGIHSNIFKNVCRSETAEKGWSAGGDRAPWCMATDFLSRDGRRVGLGRPQGRTTGTCARKRCRRGGGDNIRELRVHALCSTAHRQRARAHNRYSTTL